MPSGDFRTPQDIQESPNPGQTPTPNCLTVEHSETGSEKSKSSESTPVKLTGSTFFGPDFNIEAFKSKFVWHFSLYF